MLQLCFYTEAIASIQRATPEAMHVLLGIGERRTLRHADFAAYYRRVRAGFLAALGHARADRALPRRALRAVRVPPGVRRAMAAGRSPAAGGRDPARPGQPPALGGPPHAEAARPGAGDAGPHVAAHTFETLHDQAGLQLRRRTTGALDWHALPIEPGCGFEQLPRPSPGDVIFDIEGDPFWEPARGLHFLFGC